MGSRPLNIGARAITTNIATLAKTAEMVGILPTALEAVAEQQPAKKDLEADPLQNYRHLTIIPGQAKPTRRFAAKLDVATLFKKPDESKPRPMNLLALQVLKMSDHDFALLEAGVVPPGTPAENLAKEASGLIRSNVWTLIRRWQNRNVRLEYNEIYPQAEAALSLFAKKSKWDPSKGASFNTYANKYFLTFLERYVKRYDEIDNERARKNLRTYQEKVVDHNGEAAQSIWDKIGVPFEDGYHQTHTLVLTVANAIHDFLRDPSIPQLQKETFILMASAPGETVAKIYDVTQQAMSLRELAALKHFLPYLRRHLLAAEMESILSVGDADPYKLARELRALIGPEELGQILARARFDKGRWKFLRMRGGNAMPPPPKNFSLGGIASTPSLAKKTAVAGTTRQTTLPEPALERFKTTADFETITAKELEILARGRDSFVLEGLGDKTDRVYRLGTVDPAEAHEHSTFYFSITMERWVLKTGKVLFWITGMSGNHAPKIMKAMEKSKAIEVFASTKLTYESKLASTRPKGTRFKTWKDLETITPDELEVLSKKESSFILVGQGEGENIKAFDAVTQRLFQKRLRQYFKIQIETKKETGRILYEVTDAGGAGSDLALEALQQSNSVRVAPALMEATKKNVANRQRKHHPFKTLSSLGKITKSELELLTQGQDHFFLVGRIFKPDRLVALDAVGFEKLSTMNRLYFKIEIRKVESHSTYEIIHVKGTYAKEVLEALKDNKLFLFNVKNNSDPRQGDSPESHSPFPNQNRSPVLPRGDIF